MQRRRRCSWRHVSCWNVEEKWRPRGAGLSLGGAGDRECQVLRANQTELQRKEREVTEEVVRKRMEPEQESQWTSIHGKNHLNGRWFSRERGGSGALPFVTRFDLLGFLPTRPGKCEADMDKTLKTSMNSWLMDAHVYLSKAVSLRTNATG